MARRSNRHPKKDVVIIGLGGAGGIAAYVLTKAGLEVVGLEAGPHLTNIDFIKRFDEIGEDFSLRNSLGGIKFNRELPTWRPDVNTPTSTPLAVGMANAVGGSTTHYTAQYWRFLEDDFKIRSATIKRYGAGALPAGARVEDWPLSYQDLEPYYDNVEYEIGVSGKSGVNPFEAPRKRDYPMPPLQNFGFGEEMAKAMRRLHYHPFRQAAAITSVPYKGRPACSYCGFCTTGYGCWNNSKSSTLVTTIAEAEKTGKLEIRPRSRVMEIMTDKNGKASGVRYLDNNHHMHEQPAGLVILATYVYENNRLLLLSKSKAHPNGLLNNHGMVGKYYRTQVGTSVTGLFPGKNLNMWGGTAAQATVMDDLNGDHFNHKGLGFIRGASIQVGTNNMPISQALSVPPSVSLWGSAYKQWLHKNINSVGAAFAQMETLSYESNFIDLDPVKKDDLGVPVARLTYSIHDNERNMANYLTGRLKKLLLEAGASETWGGGPPTLVPVYSHAYGGTVMGSNPDSSVVNKYSIAHDVPNLAVMGGSTFVNVTGYNPTETIQALAWYASDHIAKHYDSLAA